MRGLVVPRSICGLILGSVARRPTAPARGRREDDRSTGRHNCGSRRPCSCRNHRTDPSSWADRLEEVAPVTLPTAAAAPRAGREQGEEATQRAAIPRTAAAVAARMAQGSQPQSPPGRTAATTRTTARRCTAAVAPIVATTCRATGARAAAWTTRLPTTGPAAVVAPAPAIATTTAIAAARTTAAGRLATTAATAGGQHCREQTNQQDPFHDLPPPIAVNGRVPKDVTSSQAAESRKTVKSHLSRDFSQLTLFWNSTLSAPCLTRLCPHCCKVLLGGIANLIAVCDIRLDANKYFRYLDNLVALTSRGAMGPVVSQEEAVRLSACCNRCCKLTVGWNDAAGELPLASLRLPRTERRPAIDLGH